MKTTRISILAVAAGVLALIGSQSARAAVTLDPVWKLVTPATTPADTAIPNDPYPGIDRTGYSDYITVEVLTCLRFTKGTYRMGVASDDGFKVTAGQPGPFGLMLGQYGGSRGVSESAFEFDVPEDGDYPFRLLYWQGNRGGSCEW